MLRASFRALFVAVALFVLPAAARAAEPQPKVYVVLWFDTEDYLLPASDDAALKVAKFLTDEGIRATFKVVGEKARTLEKRKRTDVIDALKKHEIGYHSNFHSVQPTPALYLSNLGWDEGVAEFERREGPGRDDVRRIFGVAPTTYGQAGSSWGPQSYGAMKNWGMEVYLDGGTHVGFDGKPHYYCGLLTLYQLRYTMRADLKAPKQIEQAEAKFADARKALLADGGGVVSVLYHPCEFVHQEFWDGVNFRKGANPPRERWKLPPEKTEEEKRAAWEVFERYVRFMKRFDDVRFVTASEAVKLYRDKAKGRSFTRDELKQIAAKVGDEVGLQQHKDYALSASEVLWLLNEYVAARAAGRDPETVTLKETPLGPTGTVTPLAEPAATDASQFGRTSGDVADSMKKHGRVPSAVWLGSTPVPPEAYLRALAPVAKALLDGEAMPENIEVKPARLRDVKYVADDGPKLWPWVIFPANFHAPALMELAKKQAWTIKLALLADGSKD
jgi:hypothetical protein